MTRSRAALALAAAVLALLAVVPNASAYVWYVDRFANNFGNDKLGRANDDGTSPNNSFLTSGSNTMGAASNGSHVFWGRGDQVGRASATGNGSDANQSFVTTQAFCSTGVVAANSTHVYWIVACNGAGNPRYIGRYALDGSNHDEDIIGSSVGVNACGLALDQTYVYWSNGQYIGRALLNGSSPEPTWRDLGAGKQACGVAVDSQYVYWAVRSTNAQNYASTIGRASKTDNANPGVNNSFITGASFNNDPTLPSSLAVDGQYVYWTHQVASGSGAIGRAPKSGGAGSASFITNVGYPQGLAIDAAGTGGPSDSDGDGVGDGADNCPSNSNPAQEDTDGDKQGDACDGDNDNDGVPNGSDNCPLNANPNQDDADHDGLADACADSDDDNDGATDGVDNCPTVANADQLDADKDGRGRACDDDDTPPILPPPPPPLVVGISTSNAAFAPGTTNTATTGLTTAAKVKRGTTFSFNLDRAARVTIQIQRKGTGRKVKGKCRRQTRSNKTKPRCTLWTNYPRHKLTREAHAGLNKVLYTGRVKNKKLVPGQYRALFTPVADGVKGKTVVVKFRVVEG